MMVERLIPYLPSFEGSLFGGGEWSSCYPYIYVCMHIYIYMYVYKYLL